MDGKYFKTQIYKFYSIFQTQFPHVIIWLIPSGFKENPKSRRTIESTQKKEDRESVHQQAVEQGSGDVGIETRVTHRFFCARRGI